MQNNWLTFTRLWNIWGIKVSPLWKKGQSIRPKRIKTLLHGRNYKKIGLVGQFFSSFFKGKSTHRMYKSITVVSILAFSASSYTLKYKFCAIHSWSASVFLLCFNCPCPYCIWLLAIQRVLLAYGYDNRVDLWEEKKIKVQKVELVRPILFFSLSNMITLDE